MTLEETIAERYRSFISVEDLINAIARQYKCSEQDARHVLSAALRISDHPEVPSLYRREKLGPELVKTYKYNEIFVNISNADRDVEEALANDTKDLEELFSDDIPF
ncbi:hypothetical protein [Halotalea alkalilenta]|uniref:hypothetical protein n=1 Tax=Halotalea alkalilenta TaxID=376489 RepID=UPI00123749DC|nr:hypothetical protein [Halotalea alkalilenta]